jgi:hypothetical protein
VRARLRDLARIYGGSEPPLVTVVRLPRGVTVQSPGVRGQLERVFGKASAALPGARTASWVSTGDRAFVSADGRTTFGLIYPVASFTSSNPYALQPWWYMNSSGATGQLAALGWTFTPQAGSGALRPDRAPSVDASPPGSGCVAGQGCGTVTARFTAVGRLLSRRSAAEAKSSPRCAASTRP